MLADNIPDIEQKLVYFKQTIDEIGKEQAVLKLSKHHSREELSFLMDQLNGRSVAAEKFPILASKEDILYPPSYYLEQTSSEKTARFKASLVTGEILIDLTGGFGIDTYFFSEAVQQTWYIEQDPVIYEIASKNLQLLNPAIKTVYSDSIQFLKGFDKKADWLYLDPIRRTKERRLSKLEEYSPGILEIQDQLFEHGYNVMIKLSPMTDISNLVKAFNNSIHHVYVLAIDNECKELLVIADGNEHADTLIESINWTKEKDERFVSSLRKQMRQPLTLSDPLRYLYEPNAAIFKAQQYDFQASNHELFKLHSNTHLYTSEEYDTTYEGKVYTIHGIYPFDAKAFKKTNTTTAFNIKTRNFPLKAEQVVKKLGIKEGGEAFLFCVKTKDEKFKLIVCSRIQ